MNTGLGQTLRQVRTQRHLSLERLAARAGVAASTISRWEREVCRPCLNELAAVWDALGGTSKQLEMLLILMDEQRAVVQVRGLMQAEAEALGAIPTGGDLLRAIRLRQGRTLAEVVEQIDVKPSTLSRWERGIGWPNTLKLQELETLIHATQEETAILNSGRSVLKELPDLTGASKDFPLRLRTLQQKMTGVHEESMDLEFLTLEAQIWPLARTEWRWRLLLMETYASHAMWLSMRERLGEAQYFADHTLNMQPDQHHEHLILLALTVSAAFAAGREGRARAPMAVEVLRNWTSALSKPESCASLWHKIANYTSLSGQTSAALTFLEQSSAFARQTEARIGLLRSNACLRAEILVRAGHYREALDQMPRDLIHKSGIYFVQEAFLWIDILIGMNRHNEAMRWHEQACCVISACNLAPMQAHADLLARQF